MEIKKKRRNCSGSAVYLGKGRNKPYAARISIGKDRKGKTIYYDINTFEEKLEALVCLENYHKEPSSLYIKEDKYNKIHTFPKNPYPLVPVKNPSQIIEEKVKKDTYTFKQLFDEFKKIKLPTTKEAKLEKEKHIKPKGKFAYHYARGMISAFHNSKLLYDKVYKNLKTSDFQLLLNTCGKKYETLKIMKNLYVKLDQYALQEDIIEKSYAQHVTLVNTKLSKTKRSSYSYEQIQYLWNICPKNPKEGFIRDILILALYTGCRIEELLFLYTQNIFLNKNYFIGGLKTQAGINREVPIHPKIKTIFLKYYNPENEFLFLMPNGKRTNYDYYFYHYKQNFIDKHPFLQNHTVHECRHTLRTELERYNVKQVIINSIIGHSNENVGQDVYTHISIEEKFEAIKLITYKEINHLHILASNQ